MSKPLHDIWTLASPAARFESGRSSVNWTEGLVTIGAAAFVIGILTEAVSESQQKAFKQGPANKGKPYGGGLFSLATNINYGGYTIWRAGYALFCGAAAWRMATFGLFASRGVPVLDHYLTEGYGDAYNEIRERAGYSLIPGIY